MHPGNDPAWKAALCGLASNNCAWKTWQVAQTFCTVFTPGGAAPWLPWQVAQLGALRSPRTAIASWCTLALYCANWSVGILYSFMWAGSAWQRAQVLATFRGWTVERESRGDRRSCTLWQS